MSSLRCAIFRDGDKWKKSTVVEHRTRYDNATTVQHALVRTPIPATVATPSDARFPAPTGNRALDGGSAKTNRTERLTNSVALAPSSGLGLRGPLGEASPSPRMEEYPHLCLVCCTRQRLRSPEDALTCRLDCCASSVWQTSRTSIVCQGRYCYFCAFASASRVSDHRRANRSGEAYLHYTCCSWIGFAALLMIMTPGRRR